MWRSKISGACTLSHEPFPYQDIWDPLGRVFDAFGFDRCMWGTDWTRAVKLLTYKQGVEAFRITDRLTDASGQRSWAALCNKSTTGTGRRRHSLWFPVEAFALQKRGVSLRDRALGAKRPEPPSRAVSAHAGDAP